MPGYTLECGHRFDLHDVVLRSIQDGRDFCPICKTKFGSNECYYLAFADVEKISMKDFIKK